jgi:hypothetical protein
MHWKARLVLPEGAFYPACCPGHPLRRGERGYQTDSKVLPGSGRS